MTFGIIHCHEYGGGTRWRRVVLVFLGGIAFGLGVGYVVSKLGR